MSESLDWSADAFIDAPERVSVDGGTTSAGHLWHSESTRWGHSMHSMCSYHGMFPARVAHYFIQRYSRVNDTVMDPFSGRGTTALQAKVEGRRAISNDLSPLAYVLSSAKTVTPSWDKVNRYVENLEKAFRTRDRRDLDVSPDIQMLFHANTLSQLVFLRKTLLSAPLIEWDPNQTMVAGALAGIMHGGWRRDGTSQYLSISMPNTFSMSPKYVKTYIAEHQLQTLDQDVFARLREKLARLYLDEVLGEQGAAYHQDAAGLLGSAKLSPQSVDLVVTSPPYLQVVNYAQSNWIRLWFLGVDEVGRQQGEGRKRLDAVLDHGHSFDSYCDFLLRTVKGIERVLQPNGVAVLVIGDVKDPGGAEALPLASKMWERIRGATELELVDLVEDDLPTQSKVSRIWGDTKGQATTRDCALVLARRGAKARDYGSAVDWTEPWKDGGPDAAHDRLRVMRNRP